MITPAERVVQAVEENYQIIPGIRVEVAETELREALAAAMSSVGFCPDCWGKGYSMEMVEADHTAQAVPCTCPRGVILEAMVNDNVFKPRP